MPQGSILGPLLFLIFINDLPLSFNRCNLHFYADDTVMYYSHKNVDVIQSVLNDELGKLQSWMNVNRLSVNSSKTVCMLLGTRGMLSKRDNLNLEVNSIKLNQVKSFKYLGVTVDCELKWNIHIEQLKKGVGEND